MRRSPHRDCGRMAPKGSARAGRPLGASTERHARRGVRALCHIAARARPEIGSEFEELWRNGSESQRRGPCWRSQAGPAWGRRICCLAEHPRGRHAVGGREGCVGGGVGVTHREAARRVVGQPGHPLCRQIRRRRLPISSHPAKATGGDPHRTRAEGTRCTIDQRPQTKLGKPDCPALATRSSSKAAERAKPGDSRCREGRPKSRRRMCCARMGRR